MRYLFIILITCISFGQSKPKDLTEIHIYNIINTFDIETDPIIDIDFFEESYLREDNFLLLKTTDEKVVKKIYKSISQLRNYNKTQKDYNTHFGNERFKTMFVIEYNSYQDTLFYSTNTNEIYYKNYIVKDERDEFKKSLSKEIIHFVNRDLASELKKIKTITIDSINSNQVYVNNKNIQGYNRERFEKEVSQVDFVQVDSLYLGTSLHLNKDFYINNNKVTFDSENETFGFLTIENNSLKIKINNIEIKIGDSINALKNKFKSSYKKWAEMHDFFNKDENKYTDFEIEIVNTNGFVLFEIKNYKITKIYIDYN